MRKLFISLIAVLFIIGCGFFQPIPLPENFCDDQGDRSESWLLEVSDRLFKSGDMTAEDKLSVLYYNLIKVTAIKMLIAKNGEFIEHWWREIGEYYVKNAPDITWTEMIDYMFDDAKWSSEELKLIKIIVSPNAGSFKSAFKIKDWDHCANKAGHKNVGEIFGWDPI